MPTLPRTMFPLGFPAPPSSSLPYSGLPWSNQYWCQQNGLTVGLGLDGGLSQEELDTLTPADRAKFSPAALANARLFVCEIQSRHRQNKATYTSGMNKAPGYAAFREAMLVLMNKRGGIHDRLWEAMVSRKATPADALRDARFAAQESGKPFEEDDPNTIPKPASYWDNARVHLARSLFGEEAFNRHSGGIKEDYITPLYDLFTRTWGLKRETLSNIFSKRAGLAEAYQQAITEATNKPTARNLTTANRTLRCWKEVADVTGEVDSEFFQEQANALGQLWESLGRKRDKTGKTYRSGGTRQKMCSELELEVAYQHYLEVHFPKVGCLEGLLESQQQLDPQIAEPLLLDLGTDLGVQDLIHLRTEDVIHLLGLAAGSPSFPFAEPGSPIEPASESHKDTKAAIFLDWHQWLGLACLVRAWFTASLGEAPVPMLLCDEVGLGKTIQQVASIALLAHYIECQGRKIAPPPLLSEAKKHYFAGQEVIPSLPVLAIVPRALSSQWREEIERYTIRGAFQVILYSNNAQSRQEFFKPTGLWETHVTNSKQKHRTIILAELNTLGKEAEQCLEKSTRTKRNWQAAEPLKVLRDCGDTIFDKLFSLAFMDEMHTVRNPNLQWEAVLVLLSNSQVRQGATATPIWTGYMDVVSSMKLLRHPAMVGDAGFIQDNILTQMESDASKSWTQGDIMTTFATTLAKKRLDAQQLSIHDPVNLAAAVNQILTLEKKNLRAFFMAYKCLSHIKTLLGSNIIRRDLRSLNQHGQKILTLQPHIESMVSVYLTEQELEAVAEISNRRPNAVSGNAGEVAWVNFYTDYRFAAFDSQMLDRKQLQHYWSNWNLETFQQNASSKVLVMMRIVLHHLADRTNGPLFFNPDDGKPMNPPVNTPDVSATRPRKIVIFALYHLPRLVIKKALDIHSLQYRELDGDISPSQRSKALKDFENDAQVVVLLMSNVGADQPWSFSELMQILGRLWRRGQLEQVIMYRLIAAGTADATLLGIANGKELMSNHLTTGGNLLSALRGDEDLNAAELESFDDACANQPKFRRTKPTKVKSRAIKPQEAHKPDPSQPVIHNVGSATPDSVVASPPRKRLRTHSSPSTSKPSQVKLQPAQQRLFKGAPPAAKTDTTVTAQHKGKSAMHSVPSTPSASSSAVTDLTSLNNEQLRARLAALLKTVPLDQIEANPKLKRSLTNAGFMASTKTIGMPADGHAVSEQASDQPHSTGVDVTSQSQSSTNPPSPLPTTVSLRLSVPSCEAPSSPLSVPASPPNISSPQLGWPSSPDVGQSSAGPSTVTTAHRVPTEEDDLPSGDELWQHFASEARTPLSSSSLHPKKSTARARTAVGPRRAGTISTKLHTQEDALSTEAPRITGSQTSSGTLFPERKNQLSLLGKWKFRPATDM
ncbi:hypothetical protein FRC09_008339 [Ceratobasidium sp. 395]|nr:hypothetical protein FRC09_008339 [Ceratobasidium sp. 395]